MILVYLLFLSVLGTTQIDVNPHAHSQFQKSLNQLSLFKGQPVILLLPSHTKKEIILKFYIFFIS
ncbi:MAG: hypothetical protein CMF96_11400 [Candidatus Marinimicrobia bacterium]|nr:hypothetical protein [Candidatus Neomarinimicrobiota bacterium]